VLEALPPLVLLSVPDSPPFPPVAVLDVSIIPPPGFVAERLIVAVPADPGVPAPLTIDPPAPPAPFRVKFNVPLLVEPVTRAGPVPVLSLVRVTLAPLPPVAPS